MLFNRKSESRGNPTLRPTPRPRIAPENLPTAAEQSSHARPNAAVPQSFIDASITITGDLHSAGDVRVNGRICGNVSCAQLIVGKDAAINGTVRTEQAIVRGSITGAIRASVVILQETARVRSEITYTLLAIDDGATFEGAAHRSDNPLAETEGVSPLVELQRLIAVESASAAGGAANNGRDASPENGPGISPPKSERRTANGRVDAQE